ncbi:MAG: adenylate/guanylate cyclase domain-containing protein [Lewinellaceae bacterium]|nr:adenylate/guanylate cyclase domain-containing protein [Lewinellaceae bacterium]
MRSAPRSRIRIGRRQVFWIAVGWAVLGALDALNTLALSQSAYFVPSPSFQYGRLFFVNVLAGILSGLISGTFLVFFLRERFRTKPFGVALLVNSMIISVLNFGIISVLQTTLLSFQYGNFWHPEVLAETTTLLFNRAFYLKTLGYWSVVVFLTIISLHVNEKYGRGILLKMILGHYHRPREEDRIFLFADIKSSTRIAEKLGHILFFQLLNDFFRDITNAVADTSGEIYQYVGDEIVISWPLQQGLHNDNCIRCYYYMREAIQKRANHYQERYGLVPEFKVGLHCGLVTTGEIGVIKKDIVFSGDVLNTAARIQAVCNKFRVSILMSKPLLDHLQLPPHLYHLKRVGIIALKGKVEKVELYTFAEAMRTSYEGLLITAT